MISGFFAYRSPTPLGPFILWAEKDAPSMPLPFRSSPVFPRAWTLSEKKRILLPLAFSYSLTHFTRLSIGSMAPTTLFTAITATTLVSGVRAAESSSGDTKPPLALSFTMFQPSFFRYGSQEDTASCSILDTTIVPFSIHKRDEKNSAIDSVAPLVNMRFLSSTPSRAAI